MLSQPALTMAQQSAAQRPVLPRLRLPTDAVDVDVSARQPSPPSRPARRSRLGAVARSYSRPRFYVREGRSKNPFSTGSEKPSKISNGHIGDKVFQKYLILERRRVWATSRMQRSGRSSKPNRGASLATASRIRTFDSRTRAGRYRSPRVQPEPKTLLGLKRSLCAKRRCASRRLVLGAKVGAGPGAVADLTIQLGWNRPLRHVAGIRFALPTDFRELRQGTRGS